MSELRDAFDERLAEVRSYLELLASMEREARDGPPRFAKATKPITPQQQKLLYAGLYLQLYNLIEATVTLCIQSVAEAAAEDAHWRPQDLSDALRTEWIRSTAKIDADLNFPNRLKATKEVADHLIELRPLVPFEIAKGGGGNWDDQSIDKISKRLGCRLGVSRAVMREIKKPVKDDLGPLGLVRRMRNDLAHGKLSFTDSADQVTVSELKKLSKSVIDYLEQVVERFTKFVDGHEYLVADRRPVSS
jgi:hypothetical protein